MKTTNDRTQLTAHCCPACGLLCDDVALISTLPVSLNKTCTKSINFYEQAYASNTATATVAGRSVDLNTAIQAVADILRKSHQPLFAGLGTEVQGMRAIIRLAKKSNATLDHMHGEGAVRNTLTLQNSGWQNTTLTEVKNRATLVLAIGTDIVTSHPRFFERLVWNKDSMFEKTTPEVIYLGESLANTDAGVSPDGKQPTVIFAENTKLPEIINALHGLMNSKNPLNKKSEDEKIGGVSILMLRSILEKIKAAQYTVVVWAAGAFNYPNAELTIQSITQLIVKFNETVRIAGLPLNAGDGDMSANNTCTWLNGYPIRSHFNHGQLEYDVRQFATKEQLKTCDALLWTSTFNPHLPPNCDAPTIVIGHPNMKFEQRPDVFIPVGIPGIDHAGTIFRMDNVVSLPLKKQRDSTLPSLSQVIQQILDQLS
jgi:formylmethanofuran dehydrogenase subunit B